MKWCDCKANIRNKTFINVISALHLAGVPTAGSDAAGPSAAHWCLKCSQSLTDDTIIVNSIFKFTGAFRNTNASSKTYNIMLSVSPLENPRSVSMNTLHSSQNSTVVYKDRD